jgi:SAM-dependent methyltransferase
VLAAEAYEQGRPGWPREVLGLLPLADDATVLDIGAGTGKLTRTLAEHYAKVLALEPGDELRQILAARVPAAEPLAGLAESIPLGDGEVDGVFAGQSFHWFANDVALGEIARVLRPGGVLAMMWNHRVKPSPLPDAYRRRLDELRDAIEPPKIDEHLFDGQPFGERQTAFVEHEHVSSRDEVLALAASASWIIVRPDRERVLEELAALLPEGRYRFPLRTSVEWTIRL